ncbi:hypothetical protein U27_06125 [Candidatus Vecturithrix granuli]|uniref:Uncharacterized protein n=1 Tax=Vecturithrix granuli TaxID=1499967 RepID=A0A081C3J4_VECG1|nr:hypothetical protein U27_06125 [Candidatus Vecturithrix granuli]
MRRLGVVGLLLLLVGVSLAFLWKQVGLVTGANIFPWDTHFELFPTVLAIWLPGLYLFFTGMWFYLQQNFPQEGRLRYFQQLDAASYAAIVLFLLSVTVWQAFGYPDTYFRAGVLCIFLFKSMILLRALYAFPRCIRSTFLVVVSFGFYLLSLPFLHVFLFMPLFDLFQHSALLHISILVVKSICLALMSLETFRLSAEMTKSVQSAFFSWLIVSFTFPALGFPKISFILAGLLVVFILRMFISRVDTRELIKGFVRPSSLTIAFKFLIVFNIILAAGLIFWDNVRPGFDLQWNRAFEAALGTLLNGQWGIFCYAPVYWLSLFGMVYVLFFRIWNGVLLVLTGVLLYSAYHLAYYGMLGQGIHQHDIVPFLPFLGVFIAIAHSRFGKIVLFRLIVRLLIFATVASTSLLLVLSPQHNSLPSKFAEIQWSLMHAVGKDLTGFFPSTSFQPEAVPLLFWLVGVIGLAIICCYIRTRLGYPLTQKIRTFLEGQFSFQQLTFYPLLLLLFLLLGTGVMVVGKTIYPGMLEHPLELSSQTPQHILSNVEHPSASFPAKGILIVSHLTNSEKVFHKTPLASITVSDPDQKFETFILKAGKDTAEKTLDTSNGNQALAHGRAELYRSHSMTTQEGISVETHDYYTKFLFSKPLHIQKMTLKWLPARDPDISAEYILHIEEILLLGDSFERPEEGQAYEPRGNVK